MVDSMAQIGNYSDSPKVEADVSPSEYQNTWYDNGESGG